MGLLLERHGGFLEQFEHREEARHDDEGGVGVAHQRAEGRRALAAQPVDDDDRLLPHADGRCVQVGQPDGLGLLGGQGPGGDHRQLVRRDVEDELGQERGEAGLADQAADGGGGGSGAGGGLAGMANALGGGSGGDEGQTAALNALAKAYGNAQANGQLAMGKGYSANSALTPPLKGDGSSPKVDAFVDKLAEPAQAASAATGIPARFIIGQAALESGWGKSEIKKSDGSTSHNVFGIKATKDWTGKTVSTVTTEYVNGKPQRVVEKFRAYDSYQEAMTDYASLLKGNRVMRR